MGYMFDSVAKAMGGKNLEGPLADNRALEGWSPNEYKRLFILPDGLLVEKFLGDKTGRIFRLNPERVAADLSLKNNYKSPLAPLFVYKSFSCLEEVVVSRELVTDNMIGAYFAKLTESHRLRGIGVLHGRVSVDQMQEGLIKANELKKKEGFLLSEELEIPVSFRRTSNYDEYWKKFYLRPQLYALDSDEAYLNRYFEAVKKSKQSQIETESLKDRTKDMIESDRDNFQFWELILKYLKRNTDSEETELKNTLKTIVMATTNSYTDGLKEHYQDKRDDMFSIYGSFGYLSGKGEGTLKSNQQGYLPSKKSVGERSFKELGKLFKKNYKNLQSLKIPKSSDYGLLLEEAIRFLSKESTEKIPQAEVEKKIPKLTITSGNINSYDSNDIESYENLFFSEQIIQKLATLIPRLEKKLPQTTALYFKREQDGSKISVDELRELKLRPLSVELLEELNYLGAEESRIQFPPTEKLSGIKEKIDNGLDKMCHLVTKNLLENNSKSWNGLDTMSKINYIEERV